jgi:hypothetical protein
MRTFGIGMGAAYTRGPAKPWTLVICDVDLAATDHAPQSKSHTNVRPGTWEVRT